MKKLLHVLFCTLSVLCLFISGYAQTNQTVTSGNVTIPENFSAGCTYNWVNSNPSIGLAASGTGNIPAFTAINTGSTPIIATITAGPVGTFAYIANSSDGTLSIINVATNKVVSTITPPHDPFSACISTDGSKAYIGCGGGSSTISVVNTATNTITNTIPVSPAGESNDIVSSPDGSLLYVSNYVSNTVSVVNTITSTVVATIPVGAYPYGLAISPDGKKVYVGYTYNSYLSVINTATNTVSGNITLTASSSCIALSPDGSKLYALTGNALTIFNTTNNTLAGTISTGSYMSIITLSQDGTKAYVCTGTNNVLVIDLTNNKVITTITVGTNPNGICASPDGTRVYVTNSGSSTVSVINTANNTVVATVGVGLHPMSVGNFVTAGSGCPTTPVSFTITVNPTTTVTAGSISGSISSCFGTASASPNIEQFTITGSKLTGDITATAPTGFELSLNSAGPYTNSVVLAQNAGVVNNTPVYVRSSATAAAGNISGNLVLSSNGVTNQTVAVSGTIYAIPNLTAPNSQSLITGATTAAINFNGTASSYNWVNDTPGIGLAASGTGNISSFTAINNTTNPITATITVTPINSTNCNGTPIKFAITVNPAPTSLSSVGTLNPLTTVYGVSSFVETFTVSGTAITSGILITPPTGFEVSTDNKSYNGTASITATGNVPSAAIYIRLAAVTNVGQYSGNIIVSTGTATSINVPMAQSEVTPATLTITADNKSKPFGAVNPILTASYNGFVNNDGPAQLTTQSTITTTAATYSTAGQYPITANGAASPNYTIVYVPGVLTIDASLSSLSIPNTFTPNGDGVNDTWIIKDIEYYSGLTVNIFNRWGVKLFSSIGYPVPWNGTYKGVKVPPGTYYYIIDPKNGETAISGWLTIIR